MDWLKRIDKIAEHYGREHQVSKAIEELGELIVELARWQNCKTPERYACERRICEEIADSQIMIDQLCHFFECGEREIKDIVKKKVERQEKRMAEEKTE